jgi:hypothetical protein
VSACTITRSRSSSLDERGVFTMASSTKVSMAARATPRPTQQKPQPARSKPCMRFMGPVTRARRSSARTCALGHEEILDGDVVAAGAAQSAHVPVVDDRALAFG